MSHLRRYATILVIIGICAAIPFYQPSTSISPIEEGWDGQTNRWQKEDLTLQLSARNERSPVESTPLHHPETGEPTLPPSFLPTPEGSLSSGDSRSFPNMPMRADSLSPHHTVKPPGGERVDSDRKVDWLSVRPHQSVPVPPPPRIAHRYEPIGPSPQDTRSSDQTTLDHMDGGPAAGEAALTSSSHPGKRHRIVDGDTLEKLAERYLGDASRSEEIFEANRDILDVPDILPLGVFLQIP